VRRKIAGEAVIAVRSKSVAAWVIFVLILLGAIAGCGGKGDDSGGPEVDGSDKETVSRDISGTFHRIEGDVAYVLTFNRDGTFKGNAWEDHRLSRSGIYQVIERERGPEVELTFDGGGKETWSAIVAEDRVQAVVNPEGEQYTRKP